MCGRLGMALVVTTALLIGAGAGGGCKHQTPEQKAQAKLAKQQAAEAKAQAKAQEKQAKAQANAQAQAAKKQAEADKKAAAEAKKQADAQAKADAKRAAEEKKQQDALAKQQKQQADAQAKADKKAADEKAAQDKKNAELAAKEQKKQADAQARADKEAAKHPEMAMSDKSSAAHADHYADDRLKVVGYPDIKPENNQRQLDKFAEAMASAGAAQDATLSDGDFDGGELNASGRSHLALALQHPTVDKKTTVYVSTVGPEDLVNARMASVERYAKASPWSSVVLTTKEGVNTTNTHPAAAGLNALKRLEKQDQGGGSSGGSGGGSTSSMNTPREGQ